MKNKMKKKKVKSTDKRTHRKCLLCKQNTWDIKRDMCDICEN